jgi:PAS domain S-box-containing protein
MTIRTKSIFPLILSLIAQLTLVFLKSFEKTETIPWAWIQVINLLSLFLAMRLLYYHSKRYSRIIAEVDEYAIIVLDIHGTILNWNKGAERIKGYSEKEILGRNFRMFYLPEDRQKQLPEQLLSEASEKGKASHEGLRLKADGSTFWGKILITALHDEKGRVIGFTKVTTDLTDTRKTEE